MKNHANRRTYGHDEIDTEGSWAISYGDLVTLLLCFFILFFTIDPKQDYQKKLQTQVFSILDKNAGSMAEAQVNPNSVSGATPRGNSETMSLGNQQKVGIDNELLKRFPGVPHRIGQKILVEFPSVSFYGSGIIDLSKEGKAALRKFVQLYMPYAGQNMLIVRAFTDTKQVRKGVPGFRDNLELSALRSVAAMRALSEAGVPMHKMRLGGYGEFQLSKLQLEAIPESRRPAAALDLARKVILLIEPEEAEL